MNGWIVAVAIALGMQAAGGTDSVPSETAVPPVTVEQGVAENSCVVPAVEEGPESEKQDPDIGEDAERSPRGGLPNIDTGSMDSEDDRTPEELQGEYADYYDYFCEVFGEDWYLDPSQLNDRPARVEDAGQYRYFFNEYAVDCRGTGSRIQDFLEERLADSEWGGLVYFEYGRYPYESDIFIYVTDDAAREKAIRLLREEYRPTPVDQRGKVQVAFYQTEMSLQRQQEMLDKFQRVLDPKELYIDHGDYYEEMRFWIDVFESETEDELPEEPYILVKVRLSIVDPDELAEQKAYATRLVEDLVRANGWEDRVVLKYDINETPENNRPNPDT